MAMDLAACFEELMARSPIPPQDMALFLREIRRTPSGTVIVSKMLAAKIQCHSEAQAIHAFELLEAALEAETEGSIEFRTEIGRYRFLNEIIRILSPKYLGDKTKEAVKERAIRFLEDAAGCKRKRWFPSEHSKIKSVYQSLIDSGIISNPARVVDEDAEFQKSIFERGENAVILKRLLQSKDPSDLQAANRLIKNLVEEEARRNERRAELHSLIDRIETSTGLLAEMLSQQYIDKEIVDELVDTCRSLRQKLGGVATETSDEATSLLQASENIEQVLLFYDEKKDSIGKNNGDQDRSYQDAASSNAELPLADQLLMNLGDEKINGLIQQSQFQPLGPTKWVTFHDSGDNLLLNLDIDITPPSIQPKNELDLNKNKPEPIEPFDEISKLSREMMEEGLKGIPNSSQLKKTDKTPLSQIKQVSQELQKSQQLPVSAATPESPLQHSSKSKDPISLLDLDFLDKLSPTGTPSVVANVSSNLNATDKLGNGKPTPKSRLSSFNEDENLLLVLENDKSSKTNGINNNSNGHKMNSKQEAKASSPKEKSSKNNSSHSESTFCWNAIRDLDLEKIDLIDELKPVELDLEECCKDVSLTLTFGKYPGFPQESVCVAVVTLTNTNRGTGLFNYVFQLLPPKGLQVKLLPPASMELPPWKKTFLPPPVLTQVALFILPNSSSSIKSQPKLKIKFILSYCNDDETMLHNGDFNVPLSIFQ